MSKLSAKAAREIALLFNSIDVSDMLKARIRSDREDGKIDSAEHNRLWDTFERKAVSAAQELYDRYGITPIGFQNKLQREAA